MTARDPPQFTPAQVLDAARRAEGEGRTEFAMQFYRHLVTNFPGTQEAAAADAGLAHLSASPDHRQANGYALPNPFEVMPGHDSYNAPSYSTHQGQITDRASHSAHTAAPGPDTGLDLPSPASDYRTGRFLARLITWLGALMILGGIAVAAAAFANPRSVASLPLVGRFITGPAFGAVLAGYGVAQIVLGQLVRALLDQANATRDMAAITRARFETRPAPHRRRSRR